MTKLGRDEGSSGRGCLNESRWEMMVDSIRVVTWEWEKWSDSKWPLKAQSTGFAGGWDVGGERREWRSTPWCLAQTPAGWRSLLLRQEILWFGGRGSM